VVISFLFPLIIIVVVALVGLLLMVFTRGKDGDRTHDSK